MFSKLQFSWKENLKKCTNLEGKKVQGIFGRTFIFVLLCSAVFRLQNYVSDSLKLICLGDKRLLSEFLCK